MILIDTNILLDLVTDDSEWFDWSVAAIESAAADGPMLINAVVYAELAARYETPASVDELIEATGVQYADIPRKAAFLAAKAFGCYRAAGGARTGVLSDFFIGAHASTLDMPLLTRDTRRYATYFPEVRLISPQMN